MSFVASLRVRMKVPIRELDIPATLSGPGFPEIELKQETRKKPVCSHNTDACCPESVAPKSDGERCTFIMRGFPGEASAYSAGKRLSDGLLASGALGNLGIDVGFDRATPQFSAAVHDAVLTQTGRELRGDLIGLMIYEQDTVTIARMDAHLVPITSAQSVQEHLTAG